jgi:hypothetical protein
MYVLRMDDIVTHDAYCTLVQAPDFVPLADLVKAILLLHKALMVGWDYVYLLY